MHIVAIGGSDAGISAALRARELDPSADVTVVVADAYPNFSICGIPYYVSGEVTHWRNLAHRTHADLEATGMNLRLDTLATGIDVTGHRLALRAADGTESELPYDKLVVGTGALPAVPPIAGLADPGDPLTVGARDGLGPADGVHLLHSMGDTFAVMDTLTRHSPTSAIVVGAGYIGLEMAEGLTTRGIQVTQIEMADEVLPTVDPALGALVAAELAAHGVEVLTRTSVQGIARAEPGATGRLRVEAATTTPDGTTTTLNRYADLVLVVTGVRPDSRLAAAAGATLGPRGAIVVNERMETGLPDVYAAGDCVITHHRLLGTTWLPLGTTAHKQGRVAGENALGGDRAFAGSLGTQVVKIFEAVAARTGLREHEALAAGYTPATSQASPDDHKAYYPGAQPITIRVTGDTSSGRLLGAQLVGRRGSEVAKRVDTYATAIFHGMTVDALADLDLSYTPPLGSPWDAVQMAAQTWVRDHQLPTQHRHSTPPASSHSIA
ncbi:CoA-disulfide reductase [Pseudofrankia sp. BMG5.36]|nr:FAD-dependent oxidoreductase [Pseudofrankia sp. BMG5.36]OHV65589.1 CoA-disulfide reductase [Pseudofrankia sp. BMG5.36]